MDHRFVIINTPSQTTPLYRGDLSANIFGMDILSIVFMHFFMCYMFFYTPKESTPKIPLRERRGGSRARLD